MFTVAYTQSVCVCCVYWVCLALAMPEAHFEAECLAVAAATAGVPVEVIDVALNITPTPSTGLVGYAFNYTLNM